MNRKQLLLFTAILVYLVIVYTGCGTPHGTAGDVSTDCADSVAPAGMKCIPGGPFVRGSERTTVDEDSGRKVRDEHPEENVEVGTFFMDVNEVTYGEYQECVKLGECPNARPNYRGYSRPKQPMLGVNWYQARQFCRSKGKRLPTEAEWEKAARGDSGEVFPWGTLRPIVQRQSSWKEGKRDVEPE